MIPVVSIVEMVVGLVEKAVEMLPKIREALASTELTPEIRAQLEVRIKAAAAKLEEWK